MDISTKAAADSLLEIERAKHAAATDTTSVEVQYQRKVALGRSGKPFVENTQDASSGAAAATGGKSAKRTI